MGDSLTIRFNFNERKPQDNDERLCRLLQEILEEIASSLHSDQDFSKALDRILGALLHVSGYDRGLLLLRDASSYAARAARGNQGEACCQATLDEKDSVIGYITKSTAPSFIADADLSPFGIPAPVRTLLGIPILFQEQVTAVALLYRDEQDKREVHDGHEEREEHDGHEERYNIDLNDLAVFATQAGIAIEYLRLFSEAGRLATTDGLTGSYNQAHLFRLADLEFHRSRRYNHPLSVFMIDIDNFREINDRYGRAVGDHILKTLCGSISQTVRNTDIIGRYGGDEFMVVLPETGGEQARTLAERLLRALLIEPFAVPGHGAFLITLSIGISCLTEGAANFSEIFERACQALSSSSKNGGNQITTYL